MSNKKINSRSTKKTVVATRSGNPSGAAGGDRGAEGEVGAVTGSRYGATLTERENKSLNRNNSVEEHPSANTGMVATVGRNVRKTGRI